MLASIIAASLVPSLVLVPSVPPSPQGDDLIEVLIKGGDQIPGMAPGWLVGGINGFSSGANGGWSCAIQASFGQSTTSNVIVGQLPGSLDGPVVMLRQDLPAGVGPFYRLGLGHLGGGRLGYDVSPLSSQSSDDSFWVDDQVIARNGQPVDGIPGAVWADLREMWMGSTGDAIIKGSVMDPSTPGLTGDVLWRWPSFEVIASEGDTIPGLPGEVLLFGSPTATSPDAQQWASLVSLTGGGGRAIVVNGDRLEYAPGAIALSGELIPPSYTGGVTGLRWLGFSELEINNRGDVAFTGAALNGGALLFVVIRDSRLFAARPVDSRLVEIDESGALLTANFVPRYESSRIVRPVPLVDVDRDGVPDSDFTSTSNITDFMTLTKDRSELVMHRILRTASGIPLTSIVRARRGRIDRTACNGLLNSTGRPAELVVSGSAIVADNQVRLCAFGLPNASAGYVLLSRTFGVVQFPNGSQGQLCLQGEIGRLQSETFLSGHDGRAAISLDLTQIPQPMGVASAMAGDSWYAQGWYRDTVQGAPTSNFTSAAGIEFQ